MHEIKLGEVGNVDMVIADLSQDGSKVNNFVSIELQAIDITGSYEPAYSAIVLGSPLDRRPTYSFNYKNVQKRFITQLIDKGFCHHHWGTKIIAVIQDTIYDRLRSKIDFPEVSIEQSNVIFMQYSMYFNESNEDPHYELQLKKVCGTTHNELMMSSLYRKSPPKAEFCARILRIHNGSSSRANL